MPTYSYHCRECGADFDRFEPITSYPNKKCEICKNKTAERKIGAGGAIVFYGKGWHSTDYRKVK
jgi:putative FmdB family regulatory protein